MSNEEEARKIVHGVNFWGYTDGDRTEDGSVYPFSSKEEAHKHAEAAGLDEIEVWCRTPEPEEVNLMEFGAYLALESKQ